MWWTPLMMQRIPMTCERRLSMEFCRMGQLQRPSKERERDVLTPIDCTHPQKPGNVAGQPLRVLSDMWHAWRAEIVCWVAESLWPFQIVKDRSFQCLMKTGRPAHYLPSMSTIARDIRAVFTQMRKQIATMMMVSILANGWCDNTEVNLLGAPRKTQFYNRWVDITQPSCICCIRHPFWH